MKLSTLSSFGSLATLIVAEVLVSNTVVRQDTLQPAELRAQNTSSVEAAKITAFDPDRKPTYCPSEGSFSETFGSSCKAPYEYYNYITFAEATTIPRSVNITLSDNDTPRLVGDGLRSRVKILTFTVSCDCDSYRWHS